MLVAALAIGCTLGSRGTSLDVARRRLHTSVVVAGCTPSLCAPPHRCASFLLLTMFCHVVESHAPETACGCRYVILGFKGLEPYVDTCRHNSAWCKVKFHN